MPVGRIGAGILRRYATFVIGFDTDSDYVCDGVDDVIQINQAIQALPATGGMIVLRAGTYDVRRSIDLRSGVSLVGEGKEATVLKLKNSFNQAINIINGSSISHVLIRDLTIDGNKNNQGGAGSMVGIKFTNVTYSIISSCRIEDMYWDNSISLISSSYNVVEDNELLRPDNSGVGIEYGLYNVVHGNHVEEPGGDGIYLYSTAANRSKHNRIVNNSIHYTGYGGVALYPFSDDNVIEGNLSVECSPGISLYGLSGQPVRYNLIKGNICRDGDVGIEGAYAQYCTIEANILEGGYWAEGISIWDSEHLIIKGNVVRDNDWGGIELVRCNQCTITGNTCIYNGNGSGIYVAAPYGAAHVLSNTIVGNTCGLHERGGIDLRYADHTSVVGNTCRQNCQYSDNTRDEIALGDCLYTTVIGNNILVDGFIRARYGISESPLGGDTCNYNVVMENVIRGPASGSFYMHGAGSITGHNVEV